MPRVFSDTKEEPFPDGREVFRLAILNATDSSALLYVNGEWKKKRRNNCKSSDIGELTDGISVGNKPKCVMNIELGDITMKLPSKLLARYRPFSSQNRPPVSANIGTRGSVVDLHDDHGTLGYTAMDSRRITFWVFYPGEENREVYETYYDTNWKYGKCESLMKRGWFLVTGPGQGVELPPGCLHATAVLVGGSLYGCNFAVAEGVDAAGQILKHDASQDRDWRPTDLSTFAQSLHAALQAGYPVFPKVMLNFSGMEHIKMKGKGTQDWAETR